MKRILLVLLFLASFAGAQEVPVKIINPQTGEDATFTNGKLDVHVDSITVVLSTNTTYNSNVSGSTVTVSNFPSVQAVSGTVSIGNLQTQVTTITVVNFPSSTTVFQGTLPWTTSGTISNFPSVQAVSQSGVWGTSATVVNFPVQVTTMTVTNFPSSTTVFQGSFPWLSSATVLNFPSNQQVNFGGSTQPVSVSNFPAQITTSTVFQGTNPWIVVSTSTISNFPSVQVVTGTVSVNNFPVQITTATVFQGTDPWRTTSTSTQISNFPSSQQVFFGTAQSVNVLSLPSSQNVVVTSTGTWMYFEMWEAARGKYYSLTTNITNIPNGTESSFLYLINPSTSATNALLNKIDFGAHTNNINSMFRVYRAPVIVSSGTQIPIYNSNTGTASQSQMMAWVLPSSVTSFGSIVFTAHAFNGITYRDFLHSRIFVPGFKFLVTVENLSNNRLASLNLEWGEEPQ